MRTEHDKLVRNKIPKIIRNSGNQCKTTTLSNLDYIKALRNKLVEEAKETAIASPEELAQELADVMEVMNALMTATEIEPEKVREIQRGKRCLRRGSQSHRGGFDNRIKLLWTKTDN